jgi:hypothetical protein
MDSRLQTKKIIRGTGLGPSQSRGKLSDGTGPLIFLGPQGAAVPPWTS